MFQKNLDYCRPLAKLKGCDRRTVKHVNVVLTSACLILACASPLVGAANSNTQCQSG